MILQDLDLPRLTTVPVYLPLRGPEMADAPKVETAPSIVRLVTEIQVPLSPGVPAEEVVSVSFRCVALRGARGAN